VRAVMSILPPGANGTTMRTGRFGYGPVGSACAALAEAQQALAAMAIAVTLNHRARCTSQRMIRFPARIAAPSQSVFVAVSS
jgi:hypothetical protein